jgi:hypothetical protein
MTFRERLKALGFNSYADYLQSAHWKAVKAAYRDSGLPRRCIACLNPRYQLHHITYERLGYELPTDFASLCKRCHDRVHAYAKVNKISIYKTWQIIREAFGLSQQDLVERFKGKPIPEPSPKLKTSKAKPKGKTRSPEDIEKRRIYREQVALRKQQRIEALRKAYSDAVPSPRNPLPPIPSRYMLMLRSDRVAKGKTPSHRKTRSLTDSPKPSSTQSLPQSSP